MIGFYVTLQRDRRIAWLAGPFATHDEAIAMVDTARRAASEVDPWTDFDAVGTSSIRSVDPLPQGKLNAMLGIGDERRAA